MNLYFLRHGETEFNANNVYYGTLDLHLNEEGKGQATRAGQLLQGISFDRIFISERKRTLETASIVLDGEKIEFAKDKRINELNFGIFEGKNYKEIQALYPDEYKLWSDDWKGYAPPEGESYIQFYIRVKAFLDDIKKLNHENILIVTHGGVIRTVYCCVLGGNMDFYWNFSSKNGDISIVKYEFGNLFIDSITHV